MAATVARANVAPAGYIAHDAFLTTSPTNTKEITTDQVSESIPTNMTSEMDPNALVFRPSNNDRRKPTPPPQGTARAPPAYDHSVQAYYNQYAQQTPLQPTYQQWPQCYGYENYGYQNHEYQNYQPNYSSAGQMYNPQYGHFYQQPPSAFHYGQQVQQIHPNHAFYNPAYPNPAYVPYSGTNKHLQYAFNSLVRNLKVKKRKSDNTCRAFTAIASAPHESTPAAGEQCKQEGYDALERLTPSRVVGARINKTYRKQEPYMVQAQATNQKKGRYGDEKIMLPPPLPSPEYLQQTVEPPFLTNGPPTSILVILDLNGTLLYRHKKNPKSGMVRPFLKPFLRSLFENFSVMIWSSAKPANVDALVKKTIDEDLQPKLVAQWARDSFGLTKDHYKQNVQVYKNLNLVWSSDVIQKHHPEYAKGQRFGQRNTVLIDDTALKASAQPHNLLKIPEFKATAHQMQDNVLQQVMGYLMELKKHGDVSRFILRQPFRVGQWSFQYPDEAGNNDETTDINGGTARQKRGIASNNDGTSGNEDETLGENDETTGNEDETLGENDETTGNKEEPLITTRNRWGP